LGAALGVLLFGVSVLVLARRPLALMVFALGSGALLGFILFFWYGWVRHHGQIYLLFVASCWLFEFLPDWRPKDRAGPARGLLARIASTSERAGWITSPLLTSLFALQLLAGAFAYGSDLMRPFSQAERVGRELQSPAYQHALLFGSTDYAVQPIAAYIDRPIFYPELDRFGTFLTWGHERKQLSPELAVERAVELTRSQDKDVVVILSYRIGGPAPGKIVPWRSEVHVEGIKHFTGAIVASENYYLYRFFNPNKTARPPKSH
jgi:hypothetical protein